MVETAKGQSVTVSARAMMVFGLSSALFDDNGPLAFEQSLAAKGGHGSDKGCSGKGAQGASALTIWQGRFRLAPPRLTRTASNLARSSWQIACLYDQYLASSLAHRRPTGR
jgi:hypothetical protein